MKPIALGQGFAPDVTIAGGLVYVAYGAQPADLVLVTLTPAGVELAREELPGGFDQSYPRFDGPWLTYRQDEAHGYTAAALNVLTRQFWVFGQAGGTYCLAVNTALGLVAYEQQTIADGWRVQFGNLVNGVPFSSTLPGAPDGLDEIVSPSRVTLRKDTRGDVPGMLHPVRRGDVTVGERPDLFLNAPPEGTAALLDGEPLRIAFADQNTPTPRCATDGPLYAIVTGGAPAVRLLLGSRADVQALPVPTEVVPPFTFAPFNHPVLIAPFKDPDGDSGAPAEIVVNQTGQYANRPFFVAEDCLDGPFRGTLIGIYTETSDPSALIRKINFTRFLLCHDSVADWTIPVQALRAWDIPCLEVYRAKPETLGQSVARWRRQVRALLQDWSGDCGLVPQFYGQGGAPPDEVWTVREVLDGLSYLSELVNLSPRIKVVAPFSWQRANGITAHPELRAAFASLLKATPGIPTLTPVKPIDPPPPPPPPPPAGQFMPATRYEVPMPKRVALRLGQMFASVDPTDKYTEGALKGWYRVRFRKESKKTDGACAFLLSNPRAGDPRLLIRPEAIPDGALSIDATEFSGDIGAQFSVKPNVTDAAWGGYEAQHGWVHKYGAVSTPVILVHYDRDGQQYESACLTVVEL